MSIYILLHTTQLQEYRTGSSTSMQQTTTICRHMVTRQVVVQNDNIEQCHIIIAILSPRPLALTPGIYSFQKYITYNYVYDSNIFSTYM